MECHSITGEGHAHGKVVAALQSEVNPVDPIVEAPNNGRRGIPLAECKNMVFMGTLACGGHARAVVTATGTLTLSILLWQRVIFTVHSSPLNVNTTVVL